MAFLETLPTEAEASEQAEAAPDASDSDSAAPTETATPTPLANEVVARAVKPERGSSDGEEVTIDATPQSPTRGASTAAPTQRAQADPLVRQWLARVHIGGATSQRIMIDGQFFNLNDVVTEEPVLVRWTGRDAQLRVFLFEDSSGFVYEKDY